MKSISLCRVSALGCAELNVPAGSWVRLEDDTAHVTCNNSGQTFTLVCEGSTWKGKISNCSKGTFNMFRRSDFLTDLCESLSDVNFFAEYGNSYVRWHKVQGAVEVDLFRIWTVNWRTCTMLIHALENYVSSLIWTRDSHCLGSIVCDGKMTATKKWRANVGVLWNWGKLNLIIGVFLFCRCIRLGFWELSRFRWLRLSIW